MISDMRGNPTIEGRILERFLTRIQADERIPPEVARRLQELCRRGEIREVSRVLDALRQGVEEHAKNSAA
jgi:hypothetical protein